QPANVVYHRLFRLRQHADDPPGLQFLRSPGGGGKVGKIVAGRKSVAFAAQQDDADRAVRLGVFERVGCSPIDAVGERILLLRPRQGDFEHAVLRRRLDVLRHGSVSVAVPTRVSQRATMVISDALNPVLSASLPAWAILM